MNSEDGLQAVIRQNVATLSQIFNTTLKSKNNLMKAQMTSLIAAVAVYSPEGYNTVRTVLDSVENRNIFKFIVECIDRESGTLLCISSSFLKSNTYNCWKCRCYTQNGHDVVVERYRG